MTGSRYSWIAWPGNINQADQDLARRAVHQVLDSALLDRHLEAIPDALPKGDLPVAFLERRWAPYLKAETQVVRMTAYSAEKAEESASRLESGRLPPGAHRGTAGRSRPAEAAGVRGKNPYGSTGPGTRIPVLQIRNMGWITGASTR